MGEITRLNELKEISEAMIVTEKNKFICSTQTISCLKEDIKSITTSKESFEKQLLQERDETTDLIVKLNTETELGMKQKMLSKENQKESTITCLKEDIKTLEISKEDFNKQLLEQRDETAELTVKLKTEIDSGNKLKMLSKKNQDEITRLNESGVMSKVMEEEKERMILCLKEDIKRLQTSKESFGKQVLLQRNESTELSVKLKMEIDSGNKLKILSKVNQDEITRLNELKELSEAMIVTEKNKFICSTQTISCLKEDIKSITTSKESFEKQLLQQRDETTDLIVKLNTETELGMKQKMLSKENQDEITRLDELRELLEARAGEKESTITCLKEDIKTLEISKEDFNKQLLEQRDETAELTVKLKTEIDSGNKLKIL